MLKLSKRSSSTVLYPARKITEFFQPVSPLALRPAVQSEHNGSRDNQHVLVDASSSGKVNGTSAKHDKRSSPHKQKKEGMHPNGSRQELSLPSRKRTRDGQLVERPTRSTPGGRGGSTAVTNGDVARRHKRSLLPAADVKERAAETSSKEGEEKRSLRSKAGGTRLKSDLATYFPNFEDVVAGVPHPPDFLTPEEPIQIIETIPQEAKRTLPITSRAARNTAEPHFERIDLFGGALGSDIEDADDPLNDDIFLPSHKRAERREKQLRNIEKERAQHEKGQLESLLESLQGPDWLRVMGVTGITDGARKDYEPRRDYFIREVKVLLRKFRVWKDAEKRLMLEKAAREEEEEVDTDADDADSDAEELEESDADDNDISTDDPDAWAARQLYLEAKSAQTKSLKLQQRPKPREKAPPKPPKPPKPPEPPKPFTSFFDKAHLRQAALSKGRHSGRRTTLAFGLPIPEPPDSEFALPENFMSREAMLAYARKRRRRNREKKEAENEA